MSLNENTISSPRDEGKSAGSFLENASRDDLIKQIKKYVVLLQKTKNKCDEMKEKYTNLEQEMMRIKENSEQKQESDNKDDGTNRKYNQAKEEMECMKMKEETLKTTIHALQEEISHLVNENKNLKCNETEFEALKMEKLKITDDFNELKSKIETQNAELIRRNEETDCERKAKTEEINKLLANRTSLEEEINRILEEKNVLKDSLLDLSENQEKIDALQEEILHLANENKTLKCNETEFEALKVEKLKIIDELKSEIEKKSEENYLIRSEMEDLKNSFDSERKAKIEETNNLISDKIRLEEEMKKLLEEKNVLKDSLEDLSENQTTDEEDLEVVLLQLDQVQNENVLLRAELENASTERDRLLFQEQREESCSVLDQIQKLESELDDSRSKLEGAEFEVEELKAKLEDNEELKLELENSKEREKLFIEFARDCLEIEENCVENALSALKSKFGELQSEVDKLSFQIEDKNVELLELREKFVSLQNGGELVEERLEEFEKLKRAEVDREKELNELKKCVCESEEKIFECENKCREALEENLKLKADLESKEKSFEFEKMELEREIERVKRDLKIQSDLALEKDEDSNLKDKLEELLDENEKLKIQLENKEKTFESEKSQLERGIEFSKNELESKCEREVENLKCQIVDFQNKLGDAMEENSRLSAELDRQVKDFETQKLEFEKEIELREKELEIKADLQDRLDESLKENERLQMQLESEEKSLEIEKSGLGKAIEFTKKELESKCEQETVLRKELDDLKNQILVLQNKLDESMDENSRLKAEIEDLKKDLSQRPSLEEFKSTLQSNKETIDREKQSTSNLKAELDKTRMDLATTKTQLVTLKAEIDLNRSDSTVTKENINELNAKVSVLTFEKEKWKTKSDDLSIETKRLNESINSITKQLEQEKESHLKTTSQLDSMQLQMKQQKLVNLEFADYERLVSDLNQQIDKSNEEKEKLKGEIKQHEEMLSGIKVQLNQVETQRKQHEERSAKMKILLLKTKKELAELVKSNSERGQVETDLKTEVEMSRNKMESMQVELSQAMGANDKLRETMATTRESHQRAVNALESRIIALQQDLEASRMEFRECKVDFDNYKVRVHSVLKQQKEKSSTVGQQEMEVSEKEYLEKALNQLKLKLEESNEHVTALQMEKNTLQDEHDRLLIRYEKTNNELQTKEKEFNEKLENLYSEEASLKHRHGEAVQQLRFQNEVIIETYKEQIKTLREEKERAVADLRAKLATAEFEVSRSHLKVMIRDENEVFDIASMERQEGEGSENTEHNSSTPIQYHYDNLSTEFSLEQLLNSKTSGVNSTAPLDEFESIEQRVLSSAKKIDHLTELLNESEATNLRLSEQTKVLKEEIRRLERNQEREKHAANMEYLKNIVLKFLTLSGGDERERLVPVLTMMLKLSPEEKNQLNIIAKGDNVEGEENAGWSNYLPRWSGLV